MEKKFLKAVTVFQNLYILFSVSACVSKSLLQFILHITKNNYLSNMSDVTTQWLRKNCTEFNAPLFCNRLL